MDPNPHTITIHLNRRFFFQLLKGFLVLLTFLLEPIILAIENRNVKRTWAVVIVFISIAVVATLGIIFLLPNISTEFQSISTYLQLKPPSVLVAELEATIEEKFPLMKRQGLSHE